MSQHPQGADGFTRRILDHRLRLAAGAPPIPPAKAAEEGGCGVVGFAASVPVRGRHIFEPSIQMHNRGNGKGGGIAAACLLPEQLGVDAATLRDDYILQVALLDPAALNEVEKTCLTPYLKIDHKAAITPAMDWRDLGLEVQPPDVVRYFVRVKDEVLDRFAQEENLTGLDRRAVEDEFMHTNSARLNKHFYTSMGDKQAFVLSHARNLIILKIVGYAEHVVQYYGMDDFKAHMWIAHQRYPTKGRVWHPGGSHPFIGMNEALVHNGDFANYYSVSEYLRQHGITTQFLTDTEVSAQLFDLWSRVYRYPLEYVIESMAPTTEFDFDRLSPEKQHIYRALQAQHIHGSPDGPWFFIISRSQPDTDTYQLLGITDTSMLRPQVFALQEGDVSIGLVASEKQAIDATLLSLSEEDPRFRHVCDRYWNARGGSATDGGAFIFTVQGNGDGYKLSCADKFGAPITVPAGEYRVDASLTPAEPAGLAAVLAQGSAPEVFAQAATGIVAWSFANLAWLLDAVKARAAQDDPGTAWALELLTLLNDRHYDTGGLKRSQVLQMVRTTLDGILDQVPALAQESGRRYARVDWDSRGDLRAPVAGEEVLVVFARDFEPEGDDCDSRLQVAAHKLGWRQFIVYGLKGQRFHGCGYGSSSEDVRLDIYGSSGDYLASGIDGLTITVHGNAQDQLGQIMKQGRLVVHGDVGQTFMYGAKGGEVYIMGNAAGRPLINAVGRPRVIINGTCLDFLAESFMAGDPLAGGGFVILNGITFDDQGRVAPQASPYPGSNLFSLASGGAIYVRDPHRELVDQQLNGGEYVELTDDDWSLILPYLQNNEALFGIQVERDLLTVDGQVKKPAEVYRKVKAKKLAVLAKQEALPE
ncbi:MAG: glutamate synthase [Deltaproteobacteria bacterium]|nr:glutamate synthase [Deltaproteobacteria bacterium]